MTDRGRVVTPTESKRMSEYRQRAETAERERDELAAWKVSAMQAAAPADKLMLALVLQTKSYLGWNIYDAAIDALKEADAEVSRLRAIIDALGPDVAIALARQANALREAQR